MAISCGLADDRLYQGDCIGGMKQLAGGSIDLVFADPPFNIGYDYDIYDDRREAQAYLDWTKAWGREVVRVLKPNGTFWLAIGDEYAAEMKTLFHRELGLSLRSWVIWYYTFGVHCTKKFARSHAHLFYFVKDPKRFTFNDQAIRVPSARQLVYADARANPKGRLPDDTWILRPQDLPDGFSADSDTWCFSRVCGTFKERAGWHGCQMPERLLGRIIEGCSNTGDIVLDPFAGSGTTLVVAKKLARRYLGFELSPEYCAQVKRRLEASAEGQPLEGVSPHESGKQTPTKFVHSQSSKKAVIQKPEDIKQGVVAAFLATRNGYSVDRVVADPEMNERFIEMCQRLGVSGTAPRWNRLIMNLRKASYFKDGLRSKRTVFHHEESDKYSFACEIAIQTLAERDGSSLDNILCDPTLAAEFDRMVVAIAHKDVLPLNARWTALRMRKRLRRPFKAYALQLNDRVPHLPAHGSRATIKSYQHMPKCPGIYLLQSQGRNLYVGETLDLRSRIDLQLNADEFGFRDTPNEEIELFYSKFPENKVQEKESWANQSILIGRLNPEGNYKKLAVSAT